MTANLRTNTGSYWLHIMIVVAGLLLTANPVFAQATNPEKLCEDTGGTWSEGTCGDSYCGQPPLCLAIIPGCDCGEGMNFGKDGCFEDPMCEGISICESDSDCEECESCIVGTCFPSTEPECLGQENKSVCEDTGGKWEPYACGDYTCGIPNPCEAIIPGCNCGDKGSFAPGIGCVEDPSCGGVPPECISDEDCGECGVCGDGTCYYLGLAECSDDSDCEAGFVCGSCSQCEESEESKTKVEICEGTGGTWVSNSCGDWKCGEQPLCEAVIPGCNCGPGMNFGEEGCFKDVTCESESEDPLQKELCVETGGTWDPLSCGNYVCGNAPECEAIEPGCNCGAGMIFGEDGCYTDPICVEEPNAKAQLCTDTGGTWDENSCGDYFCGGAPACLAIEPGCNCGPEMNFTDAGCVMDEECDAGAEISSEEGGEEPNEEGGEEPNEEGGEGEEPTGEEGDEEGDESALEQGSEAQFCIESGGTWDANSCGDWQCGEQPTCEAIIPGCNCGEGMNFTEDGCVEDEECDAPSDIMPIDDMSAPPVGDSADESGCKTPETQAPVLPWIFCLIALGFLMRRRIE